MFSPAPEIPATGSPMPHVLQRTHPPRTVVVLPQVSLGSNPMSSAVGPLPQASIGKIAGQANPGQFSKSPRSQEAALRRLEPYPAYFGGISVTLLCSDIQERLQALNSDEPALG